MSDPAMLTAAQQQWLDDRKELELVRATLEETARQLDGALAEVGLMRASLAIERDDKAMYMRRCAALEAQLGALVGRVRESCDSLVRVGNDALAVMEAQPPKRPEPLEEEKIELPIFLTQQEVAA